MCDYQKPDKAANPIEVSPEMVEAAKAVMASHCWDDGFSTVIGVDQAVEEMIRAALSVPAFQKTLANLLKMKPKPHAEMKVGKKAKKAKKRTQK